jgi:hypothetical protein
MRKRQRAEIAAGIGFANAEMVSGGYDRCGRPLQAIPGAPDDRQLLIPMRMTF